jgi:pyruvate dehydrogenase E1 component alpha subunit
MCIADVADRASAFGMPGIVVDGNDVIAVYEVAAEAIKQARKGQGPTLIECKTYRHHGHTEGDPGTAYRSKDEIEEWKAKDPIPRFENKLLELNVLTRKKMDAVKAAITKALEEGEAFAEESDYPNLGEIVLDVYAP